MTPVPETPQAILKRLADKWEGEAAHYEQRTDQDFTDFVVMLRYCSVQLESAIIALDLAPVDFVGVGWRRTGKNSDGLVLFERITGQPEATNAVDPDVEGTPV